MGCICRCRRDTPLTHPVPEPDLPAAIGPGGTLEFEGVLQADGSLTLVTPVDTRAGMEPEGD